MPSNDQGAAQQPNNDAQHQRALALIVLIQQTRDAFQYLHDEALSRIAARFEQLDQVDVVTATVAEQEKLEVRLAIQSRLSTMIDHEVDAQVLIISNPNTTDYSVKDVIDHSRDAIDDFIDNQVDAFITVALVRLLAAAVAAAAQLAHNPGEPVDISSESETEDEG